MDDKQSREAMVINQVHSIGDIIFIQPILKHFSKDRNVLLPVRDHLSYLSRYIFPGTILPMSQVRSFNHDDARVRSDYIPLRFANQVMRGYDLDDHHDLENMMLDKYRYLGLNEDLWKTLEIKWDRKRAMNLYNSLNIKEPYVLVNNHSQAGDINIQVNTDKRVIYMSKIGSYTVLDWYKLIENADEFHTVSTCTVFICQAIKNVQPVYVYPRPNEDGLRGISQLNFDYEIHRVQG